MHVYIGSIIHGAIIGSQSSEHMDKAHYILSKFGKVLIIVLLNLECNYVTITIYGLCVAPT